MWTNIMTLLGNISESLVISGRDVFDILFSLALATAVALVISQIYRHTHRGMNYELTFMTTLVLLAPIVAVVMMFIRGDLVLSLGLIGSLSIIRFRTPIKDTRDMVFLFWTIAVGLGCGTYNWMVVIISTLFILVILLALYFVRYGSSQNSDFILVISGDTPLRAEEMATIINSYTAAARVRSHEVEDQSWEIIYELRFPRVPAPSADRLIEEMKTLDGVRKVSLLAPQLALPV